MDENGKPPRRYWMVISGVLGIVGIILLGLLWWCWQGSHTTGSEGHEVPVASGPCMGGTENGAPAGFIFYDNPSLGYRFAYPESWGSVAVTTTPLGIETGNYVMGRFSANENVWFGGNATDYTVSGRDGVPTDLPGYLKASGAFYKVELWKYNTGTSIESRAGLHLLEAPYEEKAGCNATALMRSVDASEISSVGPATLALFNLKSTSAYYGVNFVLNHPTAALTDQFDKLVRSFQLY